MAVKARASAIIKFTQTHTYIHEQIVHGMVMARSALTFTTLHTQTQCIRHK